VRKTDNLSRNLGTVTSWKPLGHSGPVTGLLYLLPLKHLHSVYKTIDMSTFGFLQNRDLIFEHMWEQLSYLLNAALDGDE